MALVFAVLGLGAVAWRGLGGGFAVASLRSLVLLLLDAGVSMADVRSRSDTGSPSASS